MTTVNSTATTGPAAPAAAVAYKDGVLTVSEHRIREDEILFIVRHQQNANQPQEYHVCWLREPAAPAAGTVSTSSSDEAQQPPPPRPFAFHTTVLDESAAHKLPADVLRRHLLADIAPIFREDTTVPSTSPSSSSSSASASSSLHVIVSTLSGLGQAQAFYDEVLKPLLGVFGLTAVSGSGSENVPEGQKSYNLLVTSSSRSIAEFAQTLQKSPASGTDAPPTIVLLSGDGGVVDLLNGVAMESDDIDPRQLPAIALLPLGTGNALFHSLHRPDYLAAAASAAATGPSSFVLGLRSLVKGRAATLPNFEARFSPGSHTVSYSLQEEAGQEAALKEQAENVELLRGAIVASYGFHAQLVWESDTPEYRKHGDKRFGMAAQELLKTSHAYDADVTLTEIDKDASRSLSHRFNYILATMVSNLEKTFTISPASEPLDGQLRLVHFGDVGGAKTMDIMMAAYNNGAHIGMSWTKEAEGKDANGEVKAQTVESVGYDAIDELQVDVLEQDARWRKVCIDGTIVEIPQGGWMKVRKASKPVLQVIVNTQ
ncbi:cortical actin cytoskeleton protein vip1 [Sporothrix schenckii 1099-18]|uniref:DAGKc domain-containing protein n=2 Tax=Sporothrix schenckii TaxID=29908 RepID=U7Q790_SPOS1|nr:cortical actin cytoskeleton protein vip1 [Sporothrix schenckii 1099-18]ERT02596.1 hypothetical protein HMPREF1624_00896 [Sporothrix schenckii ATCC 58251]KJR80109.1 cortical actin cytoskeleton protein vip1 [Sporothrix schenckii 1099-18]